MLIAICTDTANRTKTGAEQQIDSQAGRRAKQIDRPDAIKFAVRF